MSKERPSLRRATRELREAGALRYFEYMVIVFVVGVGAYYLRLVDYGIFLGLMGVGIALGAITLAEVGFHSLDVRLLSIEEKIDELRRAGESKRSMEDKEKTARG